LFNNGPIAKAPIVTINNIAKASFALLTQLMISPPFNVFNNFIKKPDSAFDFNHP
jgi:hypothetical protein